MTDELLQRLRDAERDPYRHVQYPEDRTALARAAREEIERLRAEVELWKETVHDEIAANTAFREAGGALPDEDMPTFCARLLAELNCHRLAAKQLRADRDSWCDQASQRLQDWDEMRQRAERAESELAALRGRVEGAPVAEVKYDNECCTVIWPDLSIEVGKRVALVVVE